MANLAAIDLNLLVVLDALLDEAHVGRAGQRVGLSQPAASHALARLRALFGDELLVRRGARMTLTPRAEALREPVARFIDAGRAVLRGEVFDPLSSRRRFRLMLPDFLFHLLMPPLLRRLQDEAPGMRLEGLAWRGPGLLPTPAAGDIDFIITSVQREFPGYERRWLYDDRDLVAVRAGRPDRDRLGSVEGLSAARHVAVVGAGESADMLDAWLATAGLSRQTAAVAPNYVTALGIAAATDLVAIVPGRIAARLAPAFGLELIPLPVDPGADSLDLLSLVRAATDPATAWLRDRIEAVARGM